MTLPHTVVERDVTFSEAEFFRRAEAMLAGRNHALTDDGFVLDDGAKTLDATLIRPDDPTGPLKVHFSFIGHTTAEVHEWRDVIDRHFRSDAHDA